MNGQKTPPAMRRADAAVLAALVAMALALIVGLAAGLPRSRPVQAQAAAGAMGVDVFPVNNTTGSLGGTRNCLEVAVGDKFPVDIFARDLQKLVAWELRFAFDHRVVQIVDHRYDMFLTSTAPAGSIFPSLFDEESSDRYFLAAAELGGPPDTGSGILARITLEAIAPGRSQAQIVVEPGYMAPYLTTSTGASLFSGPVVGGEIAVGQPCSGTSAGKSPAPGSVVETGSTPARGSGSLRSNGEGEGGNSGVGGENADASSGERGQGAHSTPAVAGGARSPDDAVAPANDLPFGLKDPIEGPSSLALSILGALVIAGTGGVFIFMLRNRS